MYYAKKGLTCMYLKRFTVYIKYGKKNRKFAPWTQKTPCLDTIQ